MTTSSLSPGYVLLGVGSSPAAAAAARWAAAEAVRRGAALYAVHVVPATPGQEDLVEARRRTPARVGDWLADAPVLPVVAVRVTSGEIAQELRRCALEAGVVVLGSPAAGRVELPRLLAGRCPGAVVVVDTQGHAHQIASARADTAWTTVPVVREVMTSPAVTLAPDDLLATAVRRLDDYEVTSLPVVDGGGRLVGVIGEADVVRRLARTSRHDHETGQRVHDVMSPAVWSVSPDDPLLEVAELFCRTSLKSLPVVHHDRVVGVVSRRDLLRAAARHQLPASLGLVG